VLLGARRGANTLIRFYVLHWCSCPLESPAAFMIVHFLRIRKDTSRTGDKPEELPHDKVDTCRHLVVR